MTILKSKLHVFSLAAATFLSCNIYAQDGTVTINQDPEISSLMDLKKAANTSEKASNRYKIQVFSGQRSGAENTEAKFKTTFSEWQTTMVYETPNYKIWTDGFRNRLDADRALKKIRQKFPSAFIFKPKKKN